MTTQMPPLFQVMSLPVSGLGAIVILVPLARQSHTFRLTAGY